MVCKKLFLSGRVQGVSFRFYSHEKANQLGLTGWVRNLEDGRVELLVAGESDSVETMIKWAHKGPPGAHVENVEISTVKEQIPKEPFYIRRNGSK
jgi:acylphosphatase